jgi:hypothetical protein
MLKEWFVENFKGEKCQQTGMRMKEHSELIMARHTNVEVGQA